MIRRLIGFILSVIVAVILFILLLNILPIKTKTIGKVDLKYVFVDDNGSEYDIFEPTHGAARDWSFLFQNKDEDAPLINVDDNEEIDDVNESTGKNNIILENKDYVGESENKIGSETGSKQEFDNMDLNNPFNLSTGAIEQPFSGDFISGNSAYILPSGAIEKPVYENCVTPRGMTIRHNESILAYQQRRDEPDICNVQRRTCNNGILEGSFTQPSCNETAIYTYNTSFTSNKENGNIIIYNKPQVVSHQTDVTKNELIQNPKYAKNEGAEFDKNGKINSKGQNPKTERDNNDKEGMIGDYDSKEQINIKHYNCQSPWGEIVQHGQFIKAYEFPFGFTNASCKIELRLCVDGELKGSYGYSDCQYLDITYEEYNNRIESSKNVQNTTNHKSSEVESNRKFWQWLKNLFK